MILKVQMCSPFGWKYYEDVVTCSVTKNYEIDRPTNPMTDQCSYMLGWAEKGSPTREAINVFPEDIFVAPEPVLEGTTPSDKISCSGINFTNSQGIHKLVLFNSVAFLINEQGGNIDKL